MKFSELFSDVDGRLGLIAQLAMFFAAASANQTVEQSRLSKGTGLMCRPLPVIVHIKLALALVYLHYSDERVYILLKCNRSGSSFLHKNENTDTVTFLSWLFLEVSVSWA